MVFHCAPLPPYVPQHCFGLHRRLAAVVIFPGFHFCLAMVVVCRVLYYLPVSTKVFSFSPTLVDSRSTPPTLVFDFLIE